MTYLLIACAIAAGVLLVLQGGCIVALLIQRSRRTGAEQTLRASEERFRTTADHAPVMMWTARPDTTLDYFNSTCMEFTGLPIEQLLGEGWLNAVHPDDVEHCFRTYVPAFEARTPFRMEYRIRRADGAYRWVMDSGVPKYGPDGSFAGYIGSSIDITERRDAEEALRASQERYTLATAAGAVGVWDWNFETNDFYVDSSLKSILGFEDEEIPNRWDSWRSRIHQDDFDSLTAQTNACIAGKSDAFEVEQRMLHQDGSLRWFLTRGSVMKRPGGTPYRMVGTYVDITERKRVLEAIREHEAALQASDRQIQHLAGRLIAAQEVERARIARDLHDDVSQQLAGLGIALSGLKRKVGALNDQGLTGEVASLQHRTVTLAENIRHLSHDLHPSVLRHAGLVAALTAYCAELRRQQTIELTFSAEDNVESTDPDGALCLYRVAQEALRNVIMHSGARRAEVRLARRDDSVELVVVDDGKGFDLVEKRRRGEGLGLVSIHERVSLAGGTVSILTESNKGTQLRARIPASRHKPAVSSASATQCA